MKRPALLAASLAAATALTTFATTTPAQAMFGRAPIVHVNPSSYAPYCGHGFWLSEEIAGPGNDLLLYRRGERFCAIAANTTHDSRAVVSVDIGVAHGKGDPHTVASDSGHYRTLAGPVYYNARRGDFIVTHSGVVPPPPGDASYNVTWTYA